MEKNFAREKVLCASCKEEIGRQGVTFHCPQCSKREIARCLKCRRISSSYECENCEFVGP